MTDLIDRLRQSDPAEGVATYDELTVRRNLNALTGTPRVTRRAPRWALAAAAALAVAALGLGPALAPTPMVNSAAAEVLTATAEAVPADPVAGPHQYWKITEQGVEVLGYNPDDDPAHASTWDAEYVATEYVSVDGTRPNWQDKKFGELTLVEGPGSPLPPEHNNARTMDLTDSNLPKVFAYPTAAFLATLPQEPTALIAALRAEAAAEQEQAGNPADLDAATFDLIRRILVSGRADAALTSALLRSTAQLPNLVLDEDVTVRGVSGVGIRLDRSGEGTAWELVLDPADGQVLGQRHVVLAPFGRWQVGEVHSESIFTRELVDAVPQELQDRALRFTCHIEDPTEIAELGMLCEAAER